MGLIKALLNVIPETLSKTNDITQTVLGSKKEREEQEHEEFITGIQAFSKEFVNYKNRTWWDSLIDGLNRLPRPVIVFYVIFYFVSARIDPVGFQKLNISLSAVPEYMWFVLSGIICFYFHAREKQKDREKTKLALTDEEFKRIMIRMKALDKLKKEESVINSNSLEEKEKE